MIGGVTRQMLPHLPVVPHLHVNRPLEMVYLLHNITPSYRIKSLGSITSRCSGKWARTHPLFSGRIKDRTRETAEIEPNQKPCLKDSLCVITLERLSFTFTSNGKREFVPRDQVSPLLVVYCLLFLHVN